MTSLDDDDEEYVEGNATSLPADPPINWLRMTLDGPAVALDWIHMSDEFWMDQDGAMWRFDGKTCRAATKAEEARVDARWFREPRVRLIQLGVVT